MAELSDFLPDVKPFCEGVPDAVAERAILHTLREFCNESGYWREDETFTTVTDESATGEYTLAITEGTELVSVQTPIWHRGCPVELKPEHWLYEHYSKDWRTLTGDLAEYFTMTSKNIIRLVRYPTEAVTDDLRVNKILRPALAASVVDDTLRDNWSEQIGCGAIARLKSYPDQPWTDIAGVKYYLAKFQDSKYAAESQALAKWQDRRFQRNRKTKGTYY